MFPRTIKISIIAVIFIIAAWFFFGGGDAIKSAKNSDSSPTIFKQEKSEKKSPAPATPPASVQKNKKYENIQYGFSFAYPAGFIASEFPEDEGKTALVIKNSQTGQTVQIYVTAYDDPDFTVSAERVKRDLPDLPFSNSADVVVGSKAKGVAFFSENEAFGGQTAEVWFADGKLFFQVTMRGKDAKILEEVIKSWSFKND